MYIYIQSALELEKNNNKTFHLEPTHSRGIPIVSAFALRLRPEEAGKDGCHDNTNTQLATCNTPNGSPPPNRLENMSPPAPKPLVKTPATHTHTHTEQNHVCTLNAASILHKTLGEFQIKPQHIYNYIKEIHVLKHKCSHVRTMCMYMYVRCACTCTYDVHVHVRRYMYMHMCILLVRRTCSRVPPSILHG